MRSHTPVRFVTCAALTLTIASLPGPLAAQGDDISWFDNYDEAVKEAKKSQKPIFLEFRCEP